MDEKEPTFLKAVIELRYDHEEEALADPMAALMAVAERYGVDRQQALDAWLNGGAEPVPRPSLH